MPRLSLVLPWLFALASPAALAVTAPERIHLEDRLAGPALVRDVDQLERTFTTLHPGLYRYATPAEVAARIDRLRSALAAGATRREAFLAFARFAASIQCGHTYPNVLNQPEAMRTALLGGATRLPFHFRWLDGRMVVTDGFGIPDLPPGSDIVAIGGMPVADILEALLQVARADGANDAKRVAQMQVLGHDAIEAFDVYLPLLYPHLGDRPRVQWRTPDGAAFDRALQGLTLAQRRAQTPALAAPASDGAAWTLDTRDPAMAVLRMPGWALYDGRWDWRGFLTRAFEHLVADRIPALVIDLRGNEGGLGVGEVLLAHLAATPVTLPGIEHRVRTRRVPDALRRGLSTWDASFYDWGDDVRPAPDGDFVLTRWVPATGGERIAPLAPHYPGRVFVLIGPENSSATFEFAQWAKATGLATLVGQTTGGNQRGINGSAFLFMTLDHSGIELDLPLVAQHPRDRDPPPRNAGIEPDIAVTRSVADIVDGTDVEMAAVRRALR